MRPTGYGERIFCGTETHRDQQACHREARSKCIKIAGKELPQALPAKVVAQTPAGPMLQVRDFALLAVDQPGKGFLNFGASPPKLTPVVAAGYPEYLLDADSVFAQGIINQKPESLPVKFLTHSASVGGRGSAGGPVVDLCGRVVGVNTAAKNEGDPGVQGGAMDDVQSGARRERASRFPHREWRDADGG